MLRTLRILPILLLSSTVGSAQWTQWGGPSRDFTVESLPLSLPESGPALAWKVDLGDGESSVLVDGRTLYTTYRDGGDEVTVALEVATGKVRWEHRYAAPIPDGMYVEHGDGPHATPLLAGDRLFTLGITGKLHALDRESGEVIWSQDLVADHGGRPPTCGYGGSPLGSGKNIIVQVGSEKGGVMAFRMKDGEVAWRSAGFGAGYAAPRLIEVGGKTQVVAFLGKRVAGLDPASGVLRWEHPHPTEYGVNASMPVWGDDRILFISSAYDNGSRGLQLSEDGSSVKELWHQKKMQIHFTNAVRLGDLVYATSGSFGPTFLSAVHAHSGDIVWQERDVIGKASILRAGDRLLMLDEKGKLVLATVSPDGVKVLASHQLIEGRVWSPPTLVEGRLYVRNRKTLYAFDLG